MESHSQTQSSRNVRSSQTRFSGRGSKKRKNVLYVKNRLSAGPRPPHGRRMHTDERPDRIRRAKRHTGPHSRRKHDSIRHDRTAKMGQQTRRSRSTHGSLAHFSRGYHAQHIPLHHWRAQQPLNRRTTRHQLLSPHVCEHTHGGPRCYSGTRAMQC